jgi:hypothetical protein
LETLPYPLASVLWLHSIESGGAEKRYRTLLHFFEALAAFMATVHISAHRRGPQWPTLKERLQKTLGKSESGMLEAATFGTWKVIVEVLSSESRKMSDKEDDHALLADLYSVHSFQWLNQLNDSRISTLLSKANSMRNKHSGHSGRIGDAEAISIESDLLLLLAEVRSVFGRGWSRYELLLADTMKYKGGGFLHNAARIMGTRSAFGKIECTTLTPVDEQTLFILAEGEEKPLPLLPFMKMMSSPKSAANACYFYSGSGAEGQRYISYHSESESTVTDHFDDAEAVLFEFNEPLSNI